MFDSSKISFSSGADIDLLASRWQNSSKKLKIVKDAIDYVLDTQREALNAEILKFWKRVCN
ncbi:hypothetical protein CLIBASIA_02650 [Candidatus Liberibacter asiaticus str. psy62]|uniref:Uncharacterized protein n=1 Tax=Liberibacter asiaticus (strain psy62) TaxID=537021 RepID=C6XFG3_LIBAP|nr:hypothetical protein CLIBASIA_02650 [Candidatus Liberibacter asiaticus str. psy62]